VTHLAVYPRLPGAPHRSAEFLKFWVRRSVSLVGSEVSQLAMQLLAVLSLGASPGEMGVLRAVNFGPYLLSLPVGVRVDRTRRRPLLIDADLPRALLLGSIPLVAGVGVLLTPLWLLFSPVRSLHTVV
jgi:hypothetical protein